MMKMQSLNRQNTTSSQMSIYEQICLWEEFTVSHVPRDGGSTLLFNKLPPVEKFNFLAHEKQPSGSLEGTMTPRNHSEVSTNTSQVADPTCLYYISASRRKQYVELLLFLDTCHCVTVCVSFPTWNHALRQEFVEIYQPFSLQTNSSITRGSTTSQKFTFTNNRTATTKQPSLLT